MLKPYYVKEDQRFIRVVLAYQYFSLFIDEEIYHFVPVESKEIVVDRDRQRVHNVFDIFVFQRGKKIVYVSIADLLQIPAFLTHLHSIISPYYENGGETLKNDYKEVTSVIQELEKENLRRLIDKAIDKEDRETFDRLTDAWNQLYS